ncbi:uncharacterized protein [Amphiura filiformis]|uniref:uncharacterized protein n=1 Tax=Amphiura filiformis TaxID=82378 RepID=UPI003B225F51
MCSAYPFVYDRCRKMCSRCEPIGPGSPGFECTLSCDNGGYLVQNSTDCYCECTPEWKGVNCSEPCEDLRNGCQRILYACTHPRYSNYMADKCAKSCGFCASQEKDFGEFFIAHGETPRSSETMAELRKGDEVPQYGAGIELGILMDVSGSTGYTQYILGLRILKEYLCELDFRAKGGIRAAVVPFSTTSPIAFNLFDSPESIERVLRKLEKVPFQGMIILGIA